MADIKITKATHKVTAVVLTPDEGQDAVTGWDVYNGVGVVAGDAELHGVWFDDDTGALGLHFVRDAT